MWELQGCRGLGGVSVYGVQGCRFMYQGSSQFSVIFLLYMVLGVYSLGGLVSGFRVSGLGLREFRLKLYRAVLREGFGAVDCFSSRQQKILL